MSLLKLNRIGELVDEGNFISAGQVVGHMDIETLRALDVHCPFTASRCPPLERSR
jgi:hypothetical protein